MLYASRPRVAGRKSSPQRPKDAASGEPCQRCLWWWCLCTAMERAQAMASAPQAAAVACADLSARPDGNHGENNL